MSELRWSEEQLELAGLIRDLLAKQADSAAVRAAAQPDLGYDEALWRLLCEQVGVAALMVPEEYDGAGAGFAEVAVVLEQLGYALAPSPLLASALATHALLAAGNPDACARLLPDIAAGRIATVAWDGVSGSPTTPFTVADDRVTGVADLVLDGATADIVLVLAHHGDETVLVEVTTEDLDRDAVPAMDQALVLGRVRADGVAGTILGTVDPDALYAVAAAGVAALQVGVAQRGLDLTVAYSKDRVQFGRPIGSFQALKHRMADMLVQVETARSAAMDAAFAVVDGVEVPRRTSVAKAWCSEACRAVASETVQLHGGIAITWEHDAQLVFKRAHALGQLYGAAHQHRESVCR